MTAPRRRPTRCRRCPAARESACAGAAFPRLCELVDPENPDHDPAYLAVLTPAPPDPPRTLRPLGRTLALLSAMKACPQRVETPDCGCGGAAHCKSGKGRNGVVHPADCLDCLDPEHPDDPQHRNR